MNKNKEPRTEEVIFNDLSALCRESGFAHALSAFCFRDNVWGFGNELTAKDVLATRSGKALIRTELATLQGLMIKGPVDFSFPGADAVQSMMDRAEALLDELHHSMMTPMLAAMAAAMKDGPMAAANPFGTAAAIREPVFYGGDSAYDFQYQALAEIRYANDNAWLTANKGFDANEAVAIAAYLQKALSVRLIAHLKHLRAVHPNEWTMLPAFVFKVGDVIEGTGLSKSTVMSVVEAFSDTSKNPNDSFVSLSDCNTANSQPIVRFGDEEFILFQHYSLLEAIYDSPFYWMIGDKGYRASAAASRGRFTEGFTSDRLRSVFGDDRVLENVRLVDTKSNVLGEIDVLVVYGTRAIIVQAKSKKLTIAARKGNDAAMRADFTGAVQDAYDQAKSCAEFLLKGCSLIDVDGNQIPSPTGIEVVIPMCVVSDHYPALAFQTRQLLAHREDGRLIAPFVVDVFVVDVLCEILSTPLQLLSYMERRALYNDAVLANHELAVLGYHVGSNLWVDSETDMIVMDEGLAADIDVAMIARRTGVPGKRDPGGILVEFRKGTIGKLISELEVSDDSAKFDLGMMLLTLSEGTLSHLNKGIEHAARLSRADGETHDFTLSVADGATGITVHATKKPAFVAGPGLERHCEKRKYVSKAKSWFGLLIDPETLSPRTGLELRGGWQRSQAMEEATAGMRPDPLAKKKNIPDSMRFEELIRPLGRNDQCWCGSGMKYKKCHKDRDDAARTLRSAPRSLGRGR